MHHRVRERVIYRGAGEGKYIGLAGYDRWERGSASLAANGKEIGVRESERTEKSADKDQDYYHKE